MDKPKRIFINKPSITQKEIDYVNDAVAHGWGENCYDYILKFENAFGEHLDSKFAHATSSCTGAIHLTLMAMGVKAGDEIIVPEITWIASVEPILYIGAKPVFVDVLPDTWCIDPIAIEKAITPKTKAIIVVHIYGNVCNMDEILEVAQKNHLYVLEDAAEGLGSAYKGKKVGTIGDAGVFSFHGTKTITTGEGGMITSNNAEINEKVRILNDHGRNSKDPDHKMFWMRNYGYKYKISNIQAALGLAQVERLEELIEKKRQIFKWYDILLTGTPCRLNPEPPETLNGYWLPTVIFDTSLSIDRETLLKMFYSINIDVRPFFYPLSSLPMFHKCHFNTVAYDLYDRGINLPSYHDICEEDVERVVSVITNYLSR